MGQLSRCYVSTCPHRKPFYPCVFFSFPRDPERCKKWLKILDIDISMPIKNYYKLKHICSCHFTSDDLRTKVGKRLKATAVPSILDPVNISAQNSNVPLEDFPNVTKIFRPFDFEPTISRRVTRRSATSRKSNSSTSATPTTVDVATNTEGIWKIPIITAVYSTRANNKIRHIIKRKKNIGSTSTEQSTTVKIPLILSASSTNTIPTSDAGCTSDVDATTYDVRTTSDEECTSDVNATTCVISTTSSEGCTANVDATIHDMETTSVSRSPSNVKRISLNRSKRSFHEMEASSSNNNKLPLTTQEPLFKQFRLSESIRHDNLEKYSSTNVMGKRSIQSCARKISKCTTEL